MPRPSREIRTKADIRKFGWQVVLIEADEESPAYAYTIGLWHSTGHPDLVVLGLGREEATRALYQFAGQIRAGAVFGPGASYTCAETQQDFVAVPVDDIFHPEFFSHSQHFYGRRPFNLLQFIWPDDHGLYPWQGGFDDSLRLEQPVLVSPVIAQALRAGHSIG